MKFFCKKSIGLGWLFLTLAGCESMDLPHVFGDNEVPADVKSQPRLVTSVSPDVVNSMSWQRLGDVPNAPKDFTSQALISQTMQQMRDERDEAKKIQQAVDAPPPETSP